MGKSGKHKSRPHPQMALSPEALAERARQSLRAGEFRKARDDFKDLLKQGRTEYRTDLIAANLGLFRRMLSQGLRAEAQTVLENIRQMASPEEALAAEIEWLQGQGEFTRAAERVAGMLAPEGPLPLPPEKTADALVLGFTQLPSLESRMPALHAELGRIHRALDALAREAYAEAAGELQPIGFRSIFAEWKTALKGMLAFYAGDDAMARKAFGMLRDGSACRKACQAYAALLEDKSPAQGGDDGENNRDWAEGAARILGLPDLYPLLARVEYLWSRGRYRDAVFHVLETRPTLLLQETGPEAWLARFLAQGPPDSDPEKLSRYFSSWLDRTKNQEEKHLPFLAGTVALEKSESPHIVREHWEALMKEHPKARSAKAKARILLRLGRLGMQYVRGKAEEDIFPWDRRRKAGLDSKLLSVARRDLEASLRLEDGNADAWQAMTEVLELSGVKGNLNRHLERFAARFPGDLAIQEKLALESASRNAFGKSLQYLAKARALNPLDRKLVRFETFIRVDQAIGHFRKRSPEKGRLAFREALDAAADTAAFYGGRTWVLLHWHLAETASGEEAGARTVREEWDSSHPLPLYFTAFHLAAEMQLRPRQEEFAALFAEVLNRLAGPDEVKDLIRFWKEWQDSPYRPYDNGTLRRRLEPLHGLWERAFLPATPQHAYLPLLRHMHDTVAGFSVGRHCARLLKWHPKEFPLRCLKEMSGHSRTPGSLRKLHQEALHRGEKEWAAALERRMKEEPELPDIFGRAGRGNPFSEFVKIIQDLEEDEDEDEDEAWKDDEAGEDRPSPDPRPGGRKSDKRRSRPNPFQEKLPF